MAAHFGMFCTLRGVFNLVCVVWEYSNCTAAAGMAQPLLSLSYRLDRPGFESRHVGEIDVFFFLQNLQTGPHPPPALFPCYRDRSMRRTAHLHPVPNLKLSGALPTRPLRALISCIGSGFLVTHIYTFAVTVIPFIDSVLQTTLVFKKSLYVISWHIYALYILSHFFFYCICLLLAHRY